MSTQTVREKLANPFPADVRVNRQAGFIDNVLICGVESRNGRDYPLAVLKRDHARYEGVPVNADHKDAPGVADRLGWFSDVRPGSDGRPRGRLNVLKAHPLADRVFEAAERNPRLFGMSHVAVCSTSRKNGRETVESINKVMSIDLVADPATTTSLYESTMKRFREEGGIVPIGSAVLTAAAEKVRRLSDQFEQGQCTVDQFDQWVNEVLADYRKAVKVGKDVPTGESVVPTDGKAFAEAMNNPGGWAAPGRVDGKAFGDWLKSGTNTTFAEFTAPPKAGKVPSTGKAFADYLAGRPSEAAVREFIHSIKGA